MTDGVTGRGFFQFCDVAQPVIIHMKIWQIWLYRLDVKVENLKNLFIFWLAIGICCGNLANWEPLFSQNPFVHRSQNQVEIMRNFTKTKKY
jgi:hypothetical protein